MLNLCLAPCCMALTSVEVFCAPHEQLFTDGRMHARMVAACDVFQHAITGYHTLTHVGFNVRRLGVGGDTEDRWEAFGA